jgi:hypothetical protein
MKKVGDSYINTLNNEPVINYLLDENLPIKKIDPDIKRFTDPNIKKHENFVDLVRSCDFYQNDEIKIAYFSFVWDIPVPETILTINYIKKNRAKK